MSKPNPRHRAKHGAPKPSSADAAAFDPPADELDELDAPAEFDAPSDAPADAPAAFEDTEATREERR